jgi:hypothetical protein
MPIAIGILERRVLRLEIIRGTVPMEVNRIHSLGVPHAINSTMDLQETLEAHEKIHLVWLDIHELSSRGVGRVEVMRIEGNLINWPVESCVLRFKLGTIVHQQVVDVVNVKLFTEKTYSRPIPRTCRGT